MQINNVTYKKNILKKQYVVAWKWSAFLNRTKSSNPNQLHCIFK